MAIKNALVDVKFTLDVPEERIQAICKNHGLDPNNDDHYEQICNTVHEWALDNWTEYLNLINGGEPDIEVMA